MESHHVMRLWIGVVLYTALGLFGVAVFHNTTPSAQTLTDGYGVAYTSLIASQAGR
jgi:hypothetical protein